MAMLAVQPKLLPFDYQDVELLPGRLATQRAQTRDFYYNIPNDDILKGFREQAGLPAPGEEMGGWARHTADTVLGQWLSGMARLSRALNDQALRDKAVALMRGWAPCIPSLKMSHYHYDKYVCGLVDMAQYAGQDEAVALLDQLTARAEAELSRARPTPTPADPDGNRISHKDIEWYTLAENLYRAYVLTGDARYKRYADLWLYPSYWEQFTGKRPLDPHGVHAYSHVNTFSSAAMAYAVSGNSEYLQTLIGAYDHFQQVQCYATGGFGPGEELLEPGKLGGSIIDEPGNVIGLKFVGRSFETPCGSWAVLKMVRYLAGFTGQARYLDWAEQMLVNGIGAALPMFGRGWTFYYQDYRLMGGSKVYYTHEWPCCSGTYIQAVAEYSNALYYTADDGLCIANYVPSRVTWEQDGRMVTLTQETDYPESGRIQLSLRLAQPTDFCLRLRVPGWAQGMTATVNGQPLEMASAPGTWAEIRRTWRDGDTVVAQIPLPMRWVPIDAAHPNRVAMVYGPTVLVEIADTVSPASDDPAQWLTPVGAPTGEPLTFGTQARSSGTWVPFYRVGLGQPYRMYIDMG